MFSITFEATQGNSQGKLTFNAMLAIDRTKHEVMYGWTLENAMLSNTIDLEVHLELGTSTTDE